MPEVSEATDEDEDFTNDLEIARSSRRFEDANDYPKYFI